MNETEDSVIVREQGTECRTKLRSPASVAIVSIRPMGWVPSISHPRLTPQSLVCLFLLWHYKQKRAASNFLSRNISSQPHTNSDIEGGVTYFGVPVFTYTELEEATNHFDGEKELGDGGFGTVYYAVSKIQKGLFNELVDQRLGFESDDEVRRMVIAVAELAFQCLQQDNDMRPTMCEVLEALKMIESGNDLPDNLKPAFDNAGMKTNILPPPSPDCDEIGLLKKKRLLSSPISVTQKWPSTRSTTPNASA
ncbi:hypothetical protein GBA52_002554 [Prunus armeniaca]|nr:hypothetical protein GBA52_002554 [Prunus armeniaca]